jgi:hypothetical protein
MTDSNAFRLWPAEVDEEVRAVRAAVYEGFDDAPKYVQSMWCRVAEAQGALNYHGTNIDLGPVIELLQFLQFRLADQGLEIAGAAQEAVYAAWWKREPLHRQRQRSISGTLHGAVDPEVAHVS